MGNIASRVRRLFGTGRSTRVRLTTGLLMGAVYVLCAASATDAASHAPAPVSSSTTVSVVKAATEVPASVFRTATSDAVRSTRVVLKSLQPIQGQLPLTIGTKPEVLFVEATGCPQCEAESWAIVAALSKFGSFSRLSLTEVGTIRSKRVTGFTFSGASYQSPCISFNAVAARDGVLESSGSGSPTTAERAAFEAIDGTKQLPFLDINNHVVAIGSSVSPSFVQGFSAVQVARSLINPSDVVAQAILGTAVELGNTIADQVPHCPGPPGPVSPFSSSACPLLPPRDFPPSPQARREDSPAAGAARCSGG